MFNSHLEVFLADSKEVWTALDINGIKFIKLTPQLFSWKTGRGSIFALENKEYTQHLLDLPKYSESIRIIITRPDAKITILNAVVEHLNIGGMAIGGIIGFNRISGIAKSIDVVE